MIMDEVVIPLLRTISFFFDNIVYGLITPCYELLIYLSKVDLVTGNEFIAVLINRVYVLLGIFMLFKVSFSIVQYIVDPNAFTDSSKGFGKLVTNCLLSIVLLVSIPWIFQKAYELQGYIINSNAIGTLIMGTQFSSNDVSVDITNEEESGETTSMAKDVQFLMFSAFFKVNSDALGGKCANTPILGSAEMATSQTDAEADGCLTALNRFMSENEDISKSGVTLNDYFKTTASDTRKFSSFGALVTAKDEGQFIIDYMPIISAFAGGYVVLLLITFCVDIALRVIKLAFLQMIAPISIISYIDPKESMSNSKLHNWIKEVVSTYASLFIRLATIFLVMVLISAISSTIFAENDMVASTTNMFIYIFLVIGAFMFAKKVPQLIESLFGIKMSGELNLNPLKSAAVTGALGGVAGATLGGFAAYNEGKAHGEKGLRSAVSALGGAGSGLARGTWAGGKGAADGKWLKNSVRTAGDIAFSKESRREGGMLGSLRATVAGAAGIPYEVDQYDKEIGFRQNVIDQASSVKKTAEDFVKNRSTSYKNFSEEIDKASRTGTGFEFNGRFYGVRNFDGTFGEISAADITRAKQDLIRLQKTQAAEFGNTGMIGSDDFRDSTDYAELQATLEGMREYTTEHSSIDGISQVTDYKSLMDVKDSASIENTRLKQSKAYDDAKRRKEIRQRYARNDWVNEQRK